jgi:hypothetical protein
MRPFNDYPTSWGSSRASIWGTVGPASYTRITVGDAPVANGQVVQAVSFGMKFLDFVVGGLSDDARWLVVAVPQKPTVGANQSASATTYTLKWISQVTATVGGQAQTAGVEAANSTDLSSTTVRLLGIGPK